MKQRLLYIDCLRGISMLMVVFCHVELFCIDTSTFLSRIFEVPMLSNFFFISGLFAPPILSNQQLKNRVRYVLIPSISVFFLYVYVSKSTPMLCIEQEYKHGYWFTFALFMMNSIHWVISCTCRRLKDKVILIVLIVVAICLIALKNWDWQHNEAFLSRWFCLRLTAEHFPYYVMGIGCKLFHDHWHSLIQKEWVTSVCFILFTLLLVYPGGLYKALAIGFLGIYLLYRLCYKYQDFFSDQTCIGRQVSMIGRNTLPIYLIHYFFFLGLKTPIIGEIFNVETQWWIIAMFSTAFTIVVVYSSVMVGKIIAISKPLYTIMLGK